MIKVVGKIELESKKKVIVYVDGFNFYFGLKSKQWKQYYWLDFVGFFSSFIKPYQELIEVNYFSARPTNPAKLDRQDRLFSANLLNPRFRLHLGKYLRKNVTCRNCGSIIHSFEEKETDVRLATKMLSDAYSGSCDIAILVSADSDFIPPIEAIRSINPKQKVFVYFPPDRHSTNLQNICDGYKSLDGAGLQFKSNMLPDKITKPDGYVLERPINWI